MDQAGSVPPRRSDLPPIEVERVYGARPEPGGRFLVERLWPRGVRKEDLAMDGWVRDAAPSDPLRRWFAHDPNKWDEFRRRYFAELDARPEAWRPLAEAAARSRITLLFSARDEEHNNAVALKEYLEMNRRGSRPRPGSGRVRRDG